MNNKITIHNPVLKDRLRAADVAATIGDPDNWFLSVRVLNIKPYMAQFPQLTEEMLIEYGRVRLTLDEARQMAAMLLQAVEFAEQGQQESS